MSSLKDFKDLTMKIVVIKFNTELLFRIHLRLLNFQVLPFYWSMVKVKQDIKCWERGGQNAWVPSVVGLDWLLASFSQAYLPLYMSLCSINGIAESWLTLDVNGLCVNLNVVVEVLPPSPHFPPQSADCFDVNDGHLAAEETGRLPSFD